MVAVVSNMWSWIRLVVIGVLASGLTLGGLWLLNLGLHLTDYQHRPHAWIFQSKEFFIDPGATTNILTTDFFEIFALRPDAHDVPGLGESDSAGFRLPGLRPADQLEKSDQLIITIGDSFTYGHGLLHQETWQTKLEQTLNRRGHSVKILNAGVPGSATDQQFIRLERMVRHYRPKLVLWMLNTNDIDETLDMCLFAEVGNTYLQLPAFFNVAYQNAVVMKYLPNLFVASDLGNALTTRVHLTRQQATMGCAISTEDENVKIAWYGKRLAYFWHRLGMLEEQTGTRVLVLIAPNQLYFDPRTNPDSAAISRILWLEQFAALQSHVLFDTNMLIADELVPEVLTQPRRFLPGGRAIEWSAEDSKVGRRPLHTSAWFIDESSIRAPIGYWHPNGQLTSIMAAKLTPFVMTSLGGRQVGPSCTSQTNQCLY